MKQRRGFTVIELTIVLVLISLLSVVIFNRFTARDPAKLKSAAEQVASDIRYTQQLSITTRKQHAIGFFPTLERYDVFDDLGVEVKDPLNPDKTFLIDFTKEPFIGVDLFSATFVDTASATSTVLGFNSNGIPKAGNATLNLNSQGQVRLRLGGDERIVTVEPETGRVGVQ